MSDTFSHTRQRIIGAASRTVSIFSSAQPPKHVLSIAERAGFRDTRLHRLRPVVGALFKRSAPIPTRTQRKTQKMYRTPLIPPTHACPLHEYYAAAHS